MKKKTFSEKMKEFSEVARQIGLIEFIIFIVASVFMLRALGTLMLVINNASDYLTTAETFVLLTEYTLWLLWTYVEIKAIIAFFRKALRLAKVARPGKFEVVKEEKVAQSTMRPIEDALRDIGDRLTIIEMSLPASEEKPVETEGSETDALVTEEPVKEETKPEETSEVSEEH